MQMYNTGHNMSDKCDYLAIAFVHNQPFNCPTYYICTALTKGTIYPALDKPYIGKCGCKK